MKRLVALVMSLALMISLFSIASAEEDMSFGEKFRFEGSEDLQSIFLWEPEWNHQFTEIDGVLFDLNDQLGYNPDFDINYSDQVVTIWLYETELRMPCLVDRLSRRVLVFDFYLEEPVVELNELYSRFEDREYSINELEDDNYSIISAEDNDKRVKITIYSKVDGKAFEVYAWNFGYENDTYYVDVETFRELWYEVHKQDHTQDYE